MDATRAGLEYPGTFAKALAPRARGFGQPAGDGLAALDWLLDLAAPAADTARWTAEARGSLTEQNKPGERSTR